MKRILLAIVILAALFAATGCDRGGGPGREDIEHAREAYSKGLYLEAEKNYERYLQDEPQGRFRTEAWNRLSEIAISVKGDLDRAVVLLEAMYLELGTDPEAAWRIMFQLGDIYAQLGNRSKALESFEKCMVYAVESPEHTYVTQLRMAKLYRNMGNYDMVAVTLENCADSAKDDDAKARCLYELAQSYSFISNWNQSRRALETLLSLDGVKEQTRVLAVFLLADIYENERDYNKARELLQSIVKTYPNPKVVETRLANLPYIEPQKEIPQPPQN
ncbi:tetratricopeptide repeat protein [Pseudodesulfovibrio cashew]|uniref:Tetratricopeptide repeat protein n=1 Tax=Pseudodesulfovibrio cashew TaxID=2678688 RepID=A0A6I6JER6_9BACT|nr:tetratricopeptide repeat protein [Pseudodesulfovibrio cashew]QGY39498.1 tetratricopeptide repeat protein [Pseudodesulfovibrio cashew]